MRTCVSTWSEELIGNRSSAIENENFTRKDGFSSVEEAVEFYTEILDLTGAFVADELAPFEGQLDREGTVLEHGEVRLPEPMEKAMDKAAELGLHGMCYPRELGGSTHRNW